MSFDFLSEALKASGVKTSKELIFWTGKLDFLLREMPELPDSEKGKAELLFCWLWKEKPDRYISGGNFRLTDVIAAQIDPSAIHVGNCLGLTLLFNSLANHLGLKAYTINMEEAFGTAPHVLSLVYTEEVPVQVENILADGFNYKNHALEKQVIWSSRGLVADIYNSMGTESFLKGKLETAMSCYEKALSLNPEYMKAKLNMGLTLIQLGKEKEAERVLSQ